MKFLTLWAWVFIACTGIVVGISRAVQYIKANPDQGPLFFAVAALLLVSGVIALCITMLKGCGPDG